MRPALLRYGTVGSTMDLLHELADRGAETGTVVVAGEQTAGRGARGRTWRSPPGGLWLSALYRPPSAGGVELLSLRVGLAVADALEALAAGVSFGLKWPNDLMLGDRKLGGILCEARWQGERLAWVIAGVGVNVTNALPGEVGGAARLAEVIPGVHPEALEPEVTARLRALDPSPDRLGSTELAALRRRDWLLGRRLRAPEAGIAAGVSDEGALLVRGERGALVTVRAGSVELAEPSFTP